MFVRVNERDCVHVRVSGVGGGYGSEGRGASLKGRGVGAHPGCLGLGGHRMWERGVG